MKRLIAIISIIAATIIAAPLPSSAADQPTPEQAWQAAITEFMARDGISESEASTRLANFLVWNEVVTQIVARDGISPDQASRNLAHLLRGLTSAEAPPGQWHDLAVVAGWTEAQWPKVSCIIQRESGGDPNARSRTRDSGLMQINDMHVGWMRADGIISSRFDLFDPLTNLQAAHALFVRSGGSFGPWVGGRRC